MTHRQLDRTLNVYLLPGALFICTYLVFGFHYQSSDDALASALIRGLPFGTPVTEFYFCHRLTAIIYAHLSELYPIAPWYEMAMYALLLLAVINYFAVLYDCGKHLMPPRTITAVLIAVYGVLLLDSVTFINFTEVSIYLSASALLLALTRIINAKRKNESAADAPLIGCLVMFALGLLTRPQGGLLSFVILLPFAAVHGRQTLGSCLRYVYLPLIIVVGLLQFYDYVTRTEDAVFYRSVQPYIFNVVDVHSATATFESPADDMRKRAISSFFLADRQTTNVQFLSRLVRNDVINLQRLSLPALRSSLSGLYEATSKYHLALALLLPLLSVIPVYRRDFGRWRVLIFTVLYWLPLLLIALFWKMVPRVLTPSIVSYIIAVSVIWLVSINRKKYVAYSKQYVDWAIGAVWGLALLVLLVAWYQKMPRTTELANKVAENSTLGDALNAQCGNRTIVFTMDALNGFLKYQPPLAPHRSPANCKYLLVDSSWPTLLPQYPEHLKRATGSDLMPEVFQYLKRSNDRVIFVSTPERNAIIQKYLATVYGQEYTFDPLEFHSSLKWQGIGLYIIR